MRTALAVPVQQLARFTCAWCSYGVSVLRLPGRCPMCGNHIWKPDIRKG